MTSQRRLDQLLERWLGEGPANSPDRLLDRIADRIERIDQAPAWRVSWRDSHVNASLKPLATMAAVILLAVVGIAVVARPSGSDIGGPAATSAASGSPLASASQAWDNISGPCGEVGCRGPQTPGTYTSRGLVPAVTYTLTTPWVQLRDWQTFFMLYPDTPENRRTASATGYAPYVLILPGATVSPGRRCAEQTSGRDDRAVDAGTFSSFLFGQPGLTVSPTVPVAIGGLEGSQVDVQVGADWSGCLPGTPLGEPSSVGQRYRFIVLDIPGGDSLMIRLAAAPPADFDAFLAQAMPVVRSFVFAPTPSPSPS